MRHFEVSTKKLNKHTQRQSHTHTPPILRNTSRGNHIGKVDRVDHPLITACPNREFLPFLFLFYSRIPQCPGTTIVISAAVAPTIENT